MNKFYIRRMVVLPPMLFLYMIDRELDSDLIFWIGTPALLVAALIFREWFGFDAQH